MNHEIELVKKEIFDAFPQQIKRGVSAELVDKINETLSDPDTFPYLRDNLIGFTSVMQKGKFSIENYIDAVKYVSFKMMGGSNLQAYRKTHPDRYASMQERGLSEKDIASMISAYNRTKIVTLVYEQSLIPTWIMNADNYQEAINTQMSIMRDVDVSPKVRSDAANSILTHLKRPESSKLELDIGIKEDSALKTMQQSLADYAEMQRELLLNGSVSMKDIADSRVTVDAEYSEEGE